MLVKTRHYFHRKLRQSLVEWCGGSALSTDDISGKVLPLIVLAGNQTVRSAGLLLRLSLLFILKSRSIGTLLRMAK